MPDPQLEPEAQQLLRRIVDRPHENGGDRTYPPRAQVESWLGEQPWLLDLLFDHKLVGESDGRIVPTLAGLESSQSEHASKEQDIRTSVLERLRLSYQNGRSEERIHDGGPWTGGNVTRALQLLQNDGLIDLAQGDLFDTDTIRIKPSILHTSSSGSVQVEGEPRGDVGVQAENFRGLHHLDWKVSPGVNLLAGLNGTGKSSILQVLDFLAALFLNTPAQALSTFHGGNGLKNIHAPADAPITLVLSLGDWVWQVELSPEGRGFQSYPAEELRHQSKPVLHRSARRANWYWRSQRQDGDERSALRIAWERERPEELKPLVELLRSYRLYASPDLAAFRRGAPEGASDQLAPDGSNLLSLLGRWQSAPRQNEGRYEWVMKWARQAFPAAVEHIEFLPAGPVMTATIFPPGSPSKGYPVHVASDGLLVGLMHLAAVAGAPDNALLAFDELENHLHPHAIRSLVEAMRERAEEKNLTLLLTTHSYSLMNEFNEHRERFFVTSLEGDNAVVPVQEAYKKPGLSRFTLGALYDQNKFGGPPMPPSPDDEAAE